MQRQALIHPTLYVTFHGTDQNGRALLSGNKNPVSFRQYALGGVYSVLVDAKSKYVDAILDYDWYVSTHAIYLSRSKSNQEGKDVSLFWLQLW